MTRGRDGMMVFERGMAPRSLGVFGSDQAVDVTGAGDTVIAVFTLAIAAGGSAIEAAQLASTIEDLQQSPGAPLLAA